MIEEVRLRVRLLVAEYGVTIAAVLALVAALSFGVGAMTLADPPTETVTERTDVQRTGLEVTTSAVVTNGTELWAEGTRLDNSSLYPTDAAPELTAIMVTKVPGDRQVEVQSSLVLVVEAARDGSVFYTDRRVLDRTDTTVRDGELKRQATIDVASLKVELDRIRAELAGAGQARVRLVARTTYDTGTYRGNLTADAPLVVTERGYWIDGAMTDSEEHSTTLSRQVPRAGHQQTAAQWLLLGGILGGGAVVAWLLDRRGLEAGAIRRELAKERYEEWISEGELPMWVGQSPIRLDDLTDVVDVGIDNNKRVIHDRRRKIFAVIDGDLVYYYSHENDWSEVAWPAVTGPPREFEGESFQMRGDGPDLKGGRSDIDDEHDFGFDDDPFGETED